MRGPFHFGSAAPDARDDEGSRYDLPAPDGTCYLALSPIGAWLEVFRTVGRVATDDVRRRRILETRPPRRIRAANLLAREAGKHGLTGEIHTTRRYSLTRAWAIRLHQAGFRALLGKVRHDPSLRERSLTLLDDAGEHEPFGWRWRKEIRRLDQEEALIAAAEEYGFRVLDPPTDVVTDKPGR